ncbi:MAG: hypothetical protein BGO49_28680 [Planctomycetales bacterium 71-10]|nr:MAG: hypothetical protein BGO49_28680 [Planctomycetales bacterium 71-10]
MSAIDGFFRRPVETVPDPRLRDWSRRLGLPGASATLTLVEPPDVFDPSGPEMIVRFDDDSTDDEPWDDDLNAGLIALGVRAVDPEQEASRIALALRAALRKTERDVGDGYFNAVLLDLIRESGLDEEGEIAEVLKYVYAGDPFKGKKYDACRERMAEEIARRADELRGPLRYDEGEAKKILVAAIAKFVDRRFTVSVRRKLGWL